MATIITVHGTFATGADAGSKWWQKGSAFEASIQQFVTSAGGPVRIERLVWDGHNSETSRREAGRRLLDRLRNLESAGERYCLVGHSHGGSVILAALHRAAYGRTALPGLARWMTVGTPFIAFARRPLLFSRLGLVGKSIYISLLTFIGLISTVAWLDNPGGKFEIASFVTGMGLMVWFLAHLIMAWLVDRRLASSGVDVLERHRHSWFLPSLGLIGRLLYAIAMSVTGVMLLAIWLGETVLPNTTQRFVFTALIVLLAGGFHLTVALLSRWRQMRQRRRPQGQVALIDAYLQRWLSLRHSNDEAVEGLGRLHQVSVPIFGRDFAVAPLTFASVMAFPVLVALVILTPAIMLWISDLVTKAVPTAAVGQGAFFTNGGLIGEGRDIAANIKLLVTAPFRVMFSGSSKLSADTQTQMMLLLSPVLYFFGAMALVALSRVVAMGASRLLSRVLDTVAWRQIRGSAFGSDTLGEMALMAAPSPRSSATHSPLLPTALALEVTRVSDRAAAQAVTKLRASLSRLAFAEETRERADLVSDYLTWDELIHTAYFNVPRFNKLVAYAISKSPGFQPTQALLSDPDFQTLASWYEELCAPPKGGMA